MGAPSNPDRIKPVWLTNVDPTGELRKLSAAGNWIGHLEIVGGLIPDDQLPDEVLAADWNVVAKDHDNGRLLVARWALAATVYDDTKEHMDPLKDFRMVDRLSAGPDAALSVPTSRANFTPLPVQDLPEALRGSA